MNLHIETFWCQLCLCNEGQMEPITNSDVVSKMFEVFGIELISSEGGPSNICEFCKSKLIISAHFKRQCLKSLQTLINFNASTKLIQGDKFNDNSLDNTLKENGTVRQQPDYVYVLEDTNKTAERENNTKKAHVIDEENPINITNEGLAFVEEIETEETAEESNNLNYASANINLIEVEETVRQPQYMSKNKTTDLKGSRKTKTKRRKKNIQSNKIVEEHTEKVVTNIIDEIIDGVESSSAELTNDDPERYKIFNGKRVSYYTRCQICGKMQQNLKQHMYTHTGEKLFNCSYCGKGFSQMGNFKHHVNIHTGDKPYRCDICEKSFTEPNSLRSHMVTHTGEKKYHCDVCGKSFGYSHTLSSHKRTHTNERNFACSLCNKLFTTSNILKKHMKTHSGERPFKCAECNKSFANTYNLLVHRRTHTKERPYLCKICNSSFSYRCVLNTHMKIHERRIVNKLNSDNYNITTNSTEESQ